MNVLRKIFPAVDWLREYEIADLRGDLSAGATVGVMLIPQSMAYALLAGVPPIYGLYAGLVPLFIYTLLGTARHLAIGPVTVDMLIVGTGVGAVAGSQPEHIAFAILVAAMTGLIEILMGTFRFGFMVNFLSRPVIAGFMTAAPLIIAANQIGSLMGIETPGSQSVYQQIAAAVRNFGQVNEPAFAIGLGGIVFLFVLQTWKPRWPAALLWVLIAGAIVWMFGLEDGAVTTVGNAHDITGGLPSPTAPFRTEYFDWEAIQSLAPTALTLALVQFMYVMSLGEAFASDHDYSIDANRELFAIGTANVVGSLFRSIPVSGSFSRSAVNNRSGANTPFANVVAGTLVGLTLLFLTGLFVYLPISALAAIIMVACLGMIDVPELKHLLETRWVDGGIALVTFVATLYFGIQEGILTGVGLSILVVLRDLSRPNVVELGHVPGTQEFRDIDRNPEAERVSGIHIMRVDSRFAFANAKVLKEELLEMAEEESMEALVIDTSGVNDLDTTATQALAEVVEELADRGIEFYVAGAKGPVRDMLESSGLKQFIGESNFFLNAHQAVSHIVEEWEEEKEYAPSHREDRREQMEEAREKLERERERLEDQRRSINRERRRLKEEIAQHESERDRLDTRRNQLRKELQEAQKRREQLQSAREEYETTQEAIAERRQELAQQEEELEERQAELEEQADELEQRREEVSAAAGAAEEAPEDVRDKLEEIVEEREELLEDLEQHSAAREELEQNLEKLRDELEDAEQRRDQLRSERRELQKEREEIREERKRLEAERKKAQSGADASSGPTPQDSAPSSGADSDDAPEPSEDSEPESSDRDNPVERDESA